MRGERRWLSRRRELKSLFKTLQILKQTGFLPHLNSPLQGTLYRAVAYQVNTLITVFITLYCDFCVYVLVCPHFPICELVQNSGYVLFIFISTWKIAQYLLVLFFPIAFHG